MNIRRATAADAQILAAIMKETFDAQKQRYSPGNAVQDNNVSPPGYDSAVMHTYFIEQSHYYTIEIDGKIIGGACVDYNGRRHARLDKIFIDPAYQGRGLGSGILAFLEAEFPLAEVWKLETSGKQTANHRFYEKAGYSRIYESEAEFGYEKRIAASPRKGEPSASFKDQALPEAEFENCLMSGADFYNINLQQAHFSNTNISGSLFTDSNMSGSRFTNLNLTQSLLGDLRLTGSRIIGCDLSDVDIRHCNTAGMTIDGIPLQELLAAYAQRKA